MDKLIEIKKIIADHINRGIASFRGLHGNGEMVTLDFEEEEEAKKLLAENKSVNEIISLFHQGKLKKNIEIDNTDKKI